MPIVFIHELTNNQINNLFNLVSNPNNMQNLGNGRVWDMIKIDELIQYSAQDLENNFNENPLYMYFVFVGENDEIIGLSYVHPSMRNRRQSQIAILINPNFRHQGFGGQLVQHVINQMRHFRRHQRLFSFVKETNNNSIRLFRHYEREDEPFEFHSDVYFVYHLI